MISNKIVSLTSVYVNMPDQVRLAVDIWMPVDFKKGAKIPAVFIFTRYWRSLGFVKDNLELQPLYKTAVYFASKGYALVVADSRGSGASFGTRTGEYSPKEIGDIGQLLDWVGNQSWSNGKVASMGTSYTGNTAFIAAQSGSKMLKIVAANSSDFDSYSQLMVPGGISNSWMKGNWGEMVAAMDQNNVRKLNEITNKKTSEEYNKNFLGVRPVDTDTDGSLLREAVAEHKKNFNIGFDSLDLTFKDSTKEVKKMIESASIYGYLDSINAFGVPIFYRTGWQDAGTAEGAVSLFNSINNSIHIMIGPWDHGMSSRADPYQPGEKAQPLPLEEKLDSIFNAIDPVVNSQETISFEKMRILEYFTFGENKWKSTSKWPLPDTINQRFYLSSENTLLSSPPESKSGEDLYQVNPQASTGNSNRWHTQTGGNFVHPFDRREDDDLLLIYDSPVLEEDIEITGHPLLQLFVRSTVEDGAIFAYLEDVGPDGYVRLITEGCLRLTHAKVSEESPPYWIPGPYHSFKKKDQILITADAVTEMNFNLYPISVLIRKEHQIRLAISGADKDTFELIQGSESATYRVERNCNFPSYLQLPIIPRK